MVRGAGAQTWAWRADDGPVMHILAALRPVLCPPAACLQDPWCVPARATQIQRYYPAAERTDLVRSAGGVSPCRCVLIACSRCVGCWLLLDPHMSCCCCGPPAPCSGHCPHDDHPDLVNKELIRWVTNLDAPATA